MNNQPLVSIITVCYNSDKTIKDTIESILMQSYRNIEYVIIDGKSTDRTMDIINEYRNTKKISIKVISEKDKGLYDAMNKGIDISNGDIIGILNSDDMYVDEHVIQDIVNKFNFSNPDLVYGDLVLVDPENTSKIVRRWKSKSGKFRLGWMPPHPTVFVKKQLYDICGKFDINYKIAADYDILYRFLEKNKAKTEYVDRVLVKMRSGGESNRGLKTTIKLNKESIKALKSNNVNFASVTVILKVARKIPQVIFK